MAGRSKVGRVRVIIADDHPMFREGVARAIRERPDLELVGEAADGREAVALVEDLQPDVALLDVRMPGLQGMQALEAFKWRGAQVRVIFLSAFASGEIVHSAVAAGAMAFLSKESGRKEICEAIARVARGELMVDPRVEEDLLGAIQRHAAVDREPVISEREIEVLRLVAEGCSTSQIAVALHLSPETVKSHLKALFGKLEVSTRTAAVVSAMRRGLLR
jgi:two-component system, NarL family, nitrate/nitrite response regulator NarL